MRAVGSILLLAALAQAQTALPALVVQSGHNGKINAVAFSPDGRWLASGSADHTIRIWDTASARVARVLTGDLGEIIAVAFSPDGQVLATGSDDDTLIFWDLATGRQLRTVDSPVKLACLVFSPDGALVSTCGAGMNSPLHAWTVATGKPAARTTAPIATPSAAFGAALAALEWSLDDNRQLTFRDDALAQTASVSIAAIASAASANCCSILGASAHTLALSTADGGAAVYDLSTQRLRVTLPPPPSTTDSKGKVTRWETSDVEFSPDGAWLLAEDRNSLRLFDARTGALARVLIADMLNLGDINAAAFSPDGRYLAEASGDDPDERDFRLWSLPGAAEHRLNGFTAALVSMSLSADGSALAAATEDGRAAIWNLRTGRLAHGLAYRDADGQPQPILAVGLNHDGSRLALITGDGDSPIAIVDAASGAILRRLNSDNSTGSSGDDVEFDPAQPDNDAWPSIQYFGDDAHLLTCSHDSGALLWSLATGNVVKDFDGAYPCAPAGRAVAAFGKAKINLLHPFSPAPPPDLDSGIGLPVALSPDQRWFVYGTNDGTIDVIDLAGSPLRKLTGHTDAITAFAFSPTGQLASGSADNTIKLWDLATGRDVHTLIAHTDKITALGFAAGGRWLYSASSDGSVRLWDLHSSSLAATLLSLRGAEGWAAVAPNGLFDGSDAGTRDLVAWRLGNQLFAPDRFYSDFYTPHLLDRTLAGEPLAASSTLASLALPPAVRIVSPVSGASTSARLGVAVSARDQGGGISEVRLYQNGKLVGRASATHARGFGAAAAPYRFELTLVPGDNELRAIALARDQSEGNDDTVRVRYEGPAAAAPALHVLAIGINRYQDSSLDLGYARPDAEAIAAFFRAHAAPLFASVDVQSLTDADATRAHIAAALARLATSRPQDVVLIYLAGHGITLGEQFYFLPADVAVGADVESGVAAGGISAAFLNDALYKIPALKQLLVLDACQSGGALPLLAKAVFRAPFAEQRAKNLLARATGIYLISASLRQQYAVEVPALHHGVLTYALLSGLGEDGAPKAEVNHEGFVTVEALVQYVKHQVPLLTREYSGGEQDPIGLEYGTDFPLVVR